MVDKERRRFSPAGIPPRRPIEPTIQPTEPKTGHLVRLLQDIVAEQRDSDEVRERLAPFLGLTLPITDTALKDAFKAGGGIRDIYTRSTEYVKTHGQGLSRRWATRRVFNELAFGFLAKTAQENGDVLLSHGSRYKFFSNVYTSEEDNRIRPDGLVVNPNGKVVAATKYLVNPTDKEVRRQIAGFQDCMTRINDVVAPRPQFFIVGPRGVENYVSPDSTDVHMVPLPLSEKSVRSFGEQFFSTYRLSPSTPTLDELWQSRPANQ